LVEEQVYTAVNQSFIYCLDKVGNQDKKYTVKLSPKYATNHLSYFAMLYTTNGTPAIISKNQFQGNI
jgi:hypothetical protein